MLMAEESGERVRGRPRSGWMDGVKVALGNRVMTVKAIISQCTDNGGSHQCMRNALIMVGHISASAMH